MTDNSLDNGGKVPGLPMSISPADLINGASAGRNPNSSSYYLAAARQYSSALMNDEQQPLLKQPLFETADKLQVHLQQLNLQQQCHHHQLMASVLARAAAELSLKSVDCAGGVGPIQPDTLTRSPAYQMFRKGRQSPEPVRGILGGAASVLLDLTGSSPVSASEGGASSAAPLLADLNALNGDVGANDISPFNDYHPNTPTTNMSSDDELDDSDRSPEGRATCRRGDVAGAGGDGRGVVRSTKSSAGRSSAGVATPMRSSTTRDAAIERPSSVPSRAAGQPSGAPSYAAVVGQQTTSPTSLARQLSTTPYRLTGGNWNGFSFEKYPMIIVPPQGTIAVYLRENCIVEMTVNKTLRVECQGRFSAASSAHGNVNCILHPDGRILQQDTRVQCLFGKNKVASFGPKGVIFNMKPDPLAYVVSSTMFKGTTSIPAEVLRLPSMQHDFTISVFYDQEITGPDTVARCNELIGHYAKHCERDDGSISVTINGIYIKQDRFGNVAVNSRPRTIRFSPQKNTISVRSHFVDMAIQEDEKAYIKRGVKRVHVSKSGMVVSDGECITAMDHFGRIVSSS